MIRNPAGKQYDQHCGPEGEQRRELGGRKVNSKWSGVGDVVLLSSVMTMVDIVRMICKPHAKS